MNRVTTVWTAAVVALSLAIAVIPMLLLDARANDGAASMTALFGIPMVATGVLIELRRPRGGSRPFVVGLLPWIGGLVVGLLFLGIPATLLEPEYYDSQTQAGMLAILGAFAFVMVFGVACGVVFWVLVALPISSIAGWVRGAWRGETATPRRAALPAIVLAVEAVIVVIVVAVNGEPEELVVVQIVSALLGIPGWYEVASETVLWIARGAVVAIAATAVILTVLWYRPAVASAGQSQTR